MPLVFHWAKAPQSWDRSITNSTHRLSRCALSGPRHGGQTSLVEPVRGIGALRRRGAAGAGATAARRHPARLRPSFDMRLVVEKGRARWTAYGVKLIGKRGE